jgi:hypothetical protein
VAIEIKPTTCSIDSSLESLADGLDLTLVEEDAAARLSPTAQAWRTLTEGDQIRVRLGLEGVGSDDYGVFRVDECALEASEDRWLTRVHGRDSAALLIEDRAAEEYSHGAWDEDKPDDKTHPSARSIAQKLAARASLKLVWDAPNYTLTKFSLRPDETVAAALGRLLEPLRVSTRYRADAWVYDGNLIVRRRGNGPNLGSIDCRQGQVRRITRSRRPQVGAITVRGATYSWFEPAPPEAETKKAGTGEGEPQASVRTTEETPTHRVVETGIVQANGEFVVITRETEDLTYQDVTDAEGNWLGRVLLKSEALEEKDLHTSSSTRSRKVTSFGYDSQWRMVLRDERTEEYQADGTLKPVAHVLTRYEQATPTDVRTVTTEFEIAADKTETVKEGFPKWEQQPGHLQSVLQTAPDPDRAWEPKPDKGKPDDQKKVEKTRQYEAAANGGGAIPQVYENSLLASSAICSQIANDLAAESGKWVYVVELLWPRPFPYRKGDKVTLANLPGGCPDLANAIITAVRTTFDEEGARWEHEISLECWRDA